MPRPKSPKRIDLEQKLLEGLSKPVATEESGLKSTTAYQLPKSEPDEVLMEIGNIAANELIKMIQNEEDRKIKLDAIALGLKHFGRGKTKEEIETAPSLDSMQYILDEGEQEEEI